MGDGVIKSCADGAPKFPDEDTKSTTPVGAVVGGSTVPPTEQRPEVFPFAPQFAVNVIVVPPVNDNVDNKLVMVTVPEVARF